MQETQQSTLTDLINNEFVKEQDTHHYAMLLPLTTYIDKKDNNKEKFKGGKCSLTVEQLIEYQNTGEVLDLDQKGNSWKGGVSMKEAKLYELRLRHTNNLVMIDVDGSFGKKGDISFEEFFQIEGLPDWINECPYTLSRNKKLPHLFFRLVGIDRNKLSNIYTDCFQLFNGDLLVNHAWEKPDAIVYNYNPDCIPEVQYKDLIPLFNQSCENGNKLVQLSKEKKIKTRIVKNDEIHSEQGVSDVSFTPITETENELTKDHSAEKEKMLKDLELLHKLDKEKFDNHSTYIKIIFAICAVLDFKDAKYCKQITTKFCNEKKQNEFDNWFKSITPRNNSIGWNLIKKWISQKTAFYSIDKQIFTSGLLADLFIKLYGDDWITKDGVLYGWNGVYWETGKHLHSKLTNLIDKDLVNQLMDYSSQMPKETENDIKNIGKFISNVSTIRRLKVRNDIIADITTFSSSTNINFDTDPYKFAFTNKIFDLRTGLKIDPNREDYITLTTGYDWVEPTKEENDKMEEVVSQILPDKELRDFYLNILSTGLSGIQLQYLFVLNGKGGNGKSILDDLLLNATGNYGYKIPSKLIQEDLKTGCNPEVANLNLARFVLGQEPTANKKICCSVMKELTGSEVINARTLYSTKCDVKLNLTLFLECNDLPKLDEVNEAVERRIRIIPFSSKFVDEDKYNELIKLGHTNVFKKNVYYTTADFRTKYRCAFLKLLMKQFETFVKNNNNIPSLPPAVKLASGNYLKQNDPYFEWFNENYEKKEKSIIYLTDIYNKFKSCDYYSKLPKQIQRELKKDSFIEKLKSNLFLSSLLVLKVRDDYVELGSNPDPTRIKKDGFYGWCERIEEDDVDI